MNAGFLKQRGILLAGSGLVAAGIAIAVIVWLSRKEPQNVPPGAPPTDSEKSIQAFQAVATVFSSPRCANCHIPGESPLQGEDSHPHAMNVKRGKDGRGTPAMRCTNCHQETSSLVLHAPPGAPDWRLPPPERPMVWRGFSPGEMARMLKDRTKNGDRGLAELIEHVTTDKLVTSCWNPGPGRPLPPLSHQEFVAKFTEWVNSGAVCPE